MSRDGAVLLEVLIALAILGTAGVTAVTFLGAHMEAQRRSFQAETEVVRAERVLAATSLLRREELDMRLGQREVAGFQVLVQRPVETAYAIAVYRPSDEGFLRPLLATVVFHPRGGSDGES